MLVIPKVIVVQQVLDSVSQSSTNVFKRRQFFKKNNEIVTCTEGP